MREFASEAGRKAHEFFFSSPSSTSLEVLSRFFIGLHNEQIIANTIRIQKRNHPKGTTKKPVEKSRAISNACYTSDANFQRSF
jgi:hypothetical protein